MAPTCRRSVAAAAARRGLRIGSAGTHPFSQWEDQRVVGEERLLRDLQPAPARIRDVRQGPDGAIYIVTNANTGAAGSILKLVPKK